MGERLAALGMAAPGGAYGRLLAAYREPQRHYARFEAQARRNLTAAA